MKKRPMGLSILEIGLGKPKRNKMKKRAREEELEDDEMDFFGDMEDDEEDMDMEDMDEELELEDEEMDMEDEEMSDEDDIIANIFDAFKSKDVQMLKDNMRSYVEMLIEEMS